jgi:KaiC/GvpD/RAD55 family RecA-like ATPase
MNTTIETIEEEGGQVDPVEGEATIALGIGTVDHDGRTLESSVLEFLDDICRPAFEATILPQAKDLLRKCSGQGRIANNKTTLAIGYVQSGKTISMTTLACLARDNGYRVIIFLAGSKTNLVKQTTERVQGYLKEAGPHGAWKVVDTRLVRGTDLTRKMDEVEEQIGNLTHDDHTLVIITMKHHGHLSHLADRFDAQQHTMRHLENGGANVMIIDDEADELSPNSKVHEATESATHRELIRLREALPNFSFVQYTATPQALVALNLSDRLSPSEVTLLSPGKDYVGGRQFFASPERDRFLREAVDADEEAQEAPQQLRQAFFSYLLAAAQLDLSGKLKKKRGKKRTDCVLYGAPRSTQGATRTVVRVVEGRVGRLGLCVC